MKTVITRTGSPLDIVNETERALIQGLCNQISRSEEVAKEIVPDGGTCVLGNGIYVLMIPARCRKPVKQHVFRNPWSQGEQSRALHKMMKLIADICPQYTNALHYDQGATD